MKTLTELILEAPIGKDVLQKQIDNKERISIYYRGDAENPKGWYTIEPSELKKYKKSGKDYLSAYTVKDKKTGELNDFRSFFTLELITNWNVLSTKKTTYKNDDPIEDAVVNKRKISMYYMGDEENQPGLRDVICPVCYGSKKGVEYVRAWQEKGVSVSAEKGGKAHRPMPGWRFFRVDRIRQWKVRGTETFNKEPGPNFNKNADKMMDTIFAISDFNPGEEEPPSDIGPKTSPTPKKKAPKKQKTPTTTPTTTGPQEPEQPEKKAVKGAAKPGSKKVNIYSKGAARPGATKPADDEESNIKESFIMEGILDALRIF